MRPDPAVKRACPDEPLRAARVKRRAAQPMRDATVRIAPYDPAWPAAFVQEQGLLREILAPWLAGEIEHIGSTSVPGLAAKPIIDVMAPVVSLGHARAAIAAVTSAGYAYFPYKRDLMHWFCKPSPQRRTHHLHLVPRGSALWLERLAFRDALRKDSNLAAAYAALKARLAVQFEDDREAYTEAKSPFIVAVLEAMRGSESAV